MRIVVFGLGYVGATSMACLAKLGHTLVGVDISAEKAARVAAGESPIVEPGAAELLAEAHAAGRIFATTDQEGALESADLVLVCVGTPSRANGGVDARQLLAVMELIGAVRARTGRAAPVFVRSTALPHVHRQLIETLTARAPLLASAYCVHPEFLREGQAVADFFDPPKIVFGCTDEAAETAARLLYPGFSALSVMTTPDVAAMLKYADNSFHAVKVTFANEMGAVARSFGVDARAVMDIFCLDTKLNISTTYLKPGMPYGGSCLPKDLRSLVAWARANTVAAPMLEHVAVSNEQQIQGLVAEILRIGRARVGMIGLAFKDNTDDMRESPMVAIAEQLYGKGRALRIFDNNLTPERLIGANRTFALTSLPHLASLMTATSAELVAQSDIVVVARNLGAAAFSGLPWRRDQVVFDLIGLPEGAGVTGQVHGLYWPGTGETAAMIGAQDERELA